jgi:virginiamycin B lyase
MLRDTASMRSGDLNSRFFTALFTMACGFACLVQAKQSANTPPASAIGSTSGIHRKMTDLKPVATFNVGGDPDWMAVTGDSVWVTIASKNQIVQLRAKDNTVGFKVDVKEPCSGLVAAFGSLWVPGCGEKELLRVSLVTGKLQAHLKIAPADSEGCITSGAGSIWMASSSAGRLARINPKTNHVVSTIVVPSGSFCPLFYAGYIWMTSSEHSVLSKIDPATNRVIARIQVGKNPRFMTAGVGAIWTLNQGDGTITRVNAKTNRHVTDIPAGLAGKGGEITYGFHAVWATLEQFPITRIDAATNSIASQWSGKGGDSIRAGHGSIWLTDLRGGKVWRIDPGTL